MQRISNEFEAILEFLNYFLSIIAQFVLSIKLFFWQNNSTQKKMGKWRKRGLQVPLHTRILRDKTMDDKLT